MKITIEKVPQINHAKTGATVRGCRSKLHIEQKQLAAQMKISPSYLSDLEQGKRQWDEELFNRADQAITAIQAALQIAK